MPIPFFAEVLFNGLPTPPIAYLTLLKALLWLLPIALLKLYFAGTRNTSERLMHSKVIMITGGTSGIGASVTKSLALRGAQIILLTHHAPSDSFLVDYIEDLRTLTKNELIYAEQVDFSSLHSIRLFATKWVDNAPPRRLDMIILCANTMTPYFSAPSMTVDGVEETWAVNYLGNFHLLSILSPALRVQPPDRDVRVIYATCPSYIGGDVGGLTDSKSPLPKGKEYGTGKLAMMVFAQAFQKHLDAYKRPDKQPNNARVVVVDPGLCRTPGIRRWLSMGSLWGLLGYLLLWPVWWVFLKSAEGGAQTLLYAAMDAELANGAGGRFLKECREVGYAKDEVGDEAIAGKLWSFSERQIIALEKEGAVRRAMAKKEAEVQEKEVEGKEGKKEADLAGKDPDSGQKVRAPGSRRSKKTAR